MTEPTLPPPLPATRSSSRPLAIVSFALGVVATLTGLTAFGGLVGLAGLILGVIHLARSRARRVYAAWGIGLSAIGMALAAASMVYAAVTRVSESLDDVVVQDFFAPERWIGKPVPEMTLTALDGRTIRSTDWKGHPVVVDMWASWHPACASAVADFSRLAAETATQGVQVLAITFEDAADLGEFTTNRAFNYPLVASTNLPAPFGQVDTIPTTFFINADGLIREIRVGYEDYDALKRGALDRTAPINRKNGEE